MEAATTPTRKPHPVWRIPTYAVLTAVLVFLPLLISSDSDVLYLFLIIPALFITGICVLIFAAIRKKSRLALLVATFWAASVPLFLYSIQIRTFTKWLLWSDRYKNEVLAQPASTNGSFKHIEWDSWGWGGEDFSVFLVFDPTDSLSVPAQNHQHGKLHGIPCDVSGVRRIDSHWYLIYFDQYLDQTSWDTCK